MRDLLVEIARSPGEALAGVPAGLALLGVLIASLSGSVHCAAMCGAFPTLLRANAAGRPGALGVDVLFYHLGRFGTYVILGALAGGAGSVVLDSGVSRPLAVISAVAIGLALAVSGFGLFWKGTGRVGPPAPVRLPASKRSRRVVERLGSVAFGFARRHRSGAVGIGMISVLLPCGWLYGFVLAAAATGSAALGAAVMAAFWAGTVPALSTLPALFGAFSARAGMRLKQVAGVLLILAGVATAGIRVGPVLYSNASDSAEEASSCH